MVQSSTSEHNVSMLSWDKKSLLKYNYINVCYEILMKDTFNWNHSQTINLWSIRNRLYSLTLDI